MKLHVLGCSGTEAPGNNTSAFLIDDCLLLDAGTVCSVIDLDAQAKIRHILVTHTHLDHVKGIPLLADSLALGSPSGTAITIHSIPEIIESLHTHLLNYVMWPDFTCIPSAEAPTVILAAVETGKEAVIGGYRVTAMPVRHSIPAVGYIIGDDRSTLLYTGDTGPSDEIWKQTDMLDAAIIEVSFPDEHLPLARQTGHLTPTLLAELLRSLDRLPPRIFVTHMKTPFKETIKAELEALDIAGIEVLEEGRIYYL